MDTEKRSQSMQRRLNDRLYRAVDQGNLQATVALLHEGADPNSREVGEFKDDPNPLLLALRNNNTAMVDLLWVAGATFPGKDADMLQLLGDAAKYMRQHSPSDPEPDPMHMALAEYVQRQPAFQHLRQLTAGALHPTAESLFEDYNITFDPNLHVEQVRRSPYTTYDAANERFSKDSLPARKIDSKTAAREADAVSPYKPWQYNR